MWYRSGALLSFKVIYQISSSLRRDKIGNFDPNWAFLDCNPSLNTPMDLKWCTKLDVGEKRCLIVFLRSSAKFHTGWKIDELNPIWARLLRRYLPYLPYFYLIWKRHLKITLFSYLFSTNWCTVTGYHDHSDVYLTLTTFILHFCWSFASGQVYASVFSYLVRRQMAFG